MNGFTSDRSKFESKNSGFKDMLMGTMALDIEIYLKLNSGMPVSNTKASGNKRGGGGHMKAATTHFRSSNGGFRVQINKGYAAYQERGARADGSHQVRHYSTPGTSAGFFHRSIAAIWANRNNYVTEARRANGL